MKPSAMIDIETMASSNNAAVIAVGVAIFSDKEILSSNLWIIDAEKAKEIGEVSEQTMFWWSKQDPEVRARMFGGTAIPTDVAAEIIHYFHQWRAVEVWANAPTFDCVIMRNWFGKMNLQAPWHFRDERCCRTIYRIGEQLGFDIGSAYSEVGSHDAAVDARNQARAVIGCKKAIRNAKEQSDMYEGLKD